MLIGKRGERFHMQGWEQGLWVVGSIKKLNEQAERAEMSPTIKKPL